jgi:hypothetical protein
MATERPNPDLRPFFAFRNERERSNPDGTVAAIRTPAKGTGHVPRVARIARAAAPSDLNGLPQRRLRGAARAVRDGTR